MTDSDSGIVFDQARAASYDQRFTKLAPLRDALHLLMRIILAELPQDAQVLCVGAGTGLELLDLAHNFPQWRFTAVDPAAPMLEICRQRAVEAGVAERCTFHQGYLESLPASDPFDAATCLLVSHFLVQPEQRRRLFGEIAARLRPQAYLISADLAADMTGPQYQALLPVWLRMLQYSGVPAAEIENFRASYGRDVALLPLEQVSQLIAAGGWEPPVLFFQTLLIHAWYSRRAAIA